MKHGDPASNKCTSAQNIAVKNGYALEDMWRVAPCTGFSCTHIKTKSRLCGSYVLRLIVTCTMQNAVQQEVTWNMRYLIYMLFLSTIKTADNPQVFLFLAWCLILNVYFPVQQFMEKVGWFEKQIIWRWGLLNLIAVDKMGCGEKATLWLSFPGAPRKAKFPFSPSYKVRGFLRVISLLLPQSRFTYIISCDFYSSSNMVLLGTLT